MKIRILLPLAAAIAFTGAGPAAGAERVSASCVNSGPTVSEPIGDRDGHVLNLSTGTCVESGGPLDGIVSTQNAVWEGNAGRARLLSGDGIGRKPGALMAYRLLEGVIEPVMKDGKAVGWIATGKGVYTLAAGTAAAVAGRTFTWTTRPNGPRRYIVEAVLDD